MKTMIKTQALGVLALLAASSAALAATVTVTPNLSSSAGSPLAPGQTFTLTIHGDGFPETGGATLGLSLNTAVVAYVSGALPGTGPFSSGSFYLPHPSSGTPATFDILGPSSGTLPSGSFDALVLTFQVLNNATTQTSVNAANIQIIDNSIALGTSATLAWFDATTADPIPTSYTQANVFVGTAAAVPVPAAAWLLISALGSLVGVRRRVQS